MIQVYRTHQTSVWIVLGPKRQNNIYIHNAITGKMHLSLNCDTIEKYPDI